MDLCKTAVFLYGNRGRAARFFLPSQGPAPLLLCFFPFYIHVFIFTFILVFGTQIARFYIEAKTKGTCKQAGHVCGVHTGTFLFSPYISSSCCNRKSCTAGVVDHCTGLFQVTKTALINK
jgi:hypothetical protein